MCGFYQRHQQLRIEGLTDEHLAAFKSMEPRHPDRLRPDEAGDKAADKLAVQLIAAGLNACVRFPKAWTPTARP